MSLIFRLSCRNVSKTFLKNYIKTPHALSIARAVSVKPEITEESHDAKNKRLCRPMSPHLSIYKYQLNSFMSITQRATGLILTAIIIGLSVFAVFAPLTIEEILDDLECSDVPAGTFLLKVLLVGPLAFHYVNATRYMIWSAAKMLGLKAVFNSAIAALLIAAAAALGILALDIAP